MQTEFDTVARWTEDVLGRLGPEYAIPAACRGSASPAALDRLVEHSRLAPRSWLADVGGGIGGPAAYAREQTGSRPVVLEPMHGACHAASRVFGLDALVAAGHRLPMADAAVHAVWCLGVLCTVDDKTALVTELRRVLAPGRPLGMLVFTADEPRPAGSPTGNRFSTLASTQEMLRENGFSIESTVDVDELPTAPQDWTARVERFEEEMAALHGSDPGFDDAADQSNRMARLIAHGVVAGHLVLARAR